MKKVEFIAKKGEAAYERVLERSREWKLNNPDNVETHNREIGHERCRKGGRYYEKTLENRRTGLRGERNRIRAKHAKQYRLYKMIIAPDSQIHHEWIPKTAEYRGVALVEAMPHQYGIIDVILILDGKITLLTENDIREAC